MIRTLNRVGAFAGILFLLSATDAFVAAHRVAPRSLRAVRGEKVSVSGMASRKVDNPGELVFRADHPLLDMEIQTVDGAAWRGELFVPDAMSAGEYRFSVDSGEVDGNGVAAPRSEYHVHVYSDVHAYRLGSPSVFERIVGVSPRQLITVMLPIMLASLGLALRRSMQNEARLNARGVASIFRVVRTDSGNEINFSLGTRQGVCVGDVFGIMDTERRFIGSAVVKFVRAECCMAVAEPDTDVRRNDLVYRWNDLSLARQEELPTAVESGGVGGS